MDRDVKGAESRVWIQVVIALLSLLGVMLVLFSTSKYGAGLSPDSMEYVAAARNLLAGDGYIQSNGQPFAHWPPLFPAILAAFGLVGFDLLIAVRLVNALAFGLIVFTSGQFFLKYIRFSPFALLGVFSIVLSPPLLYSASWGLSETIFTLLLVLFVPPMIRFLKTEQRFPFGVACALGALATLQRFIGATMIVVGAVTIVLYMRWIPLARRIKYALVLGVISAAPTLGWLARNYFLTSTFSGSRGASAYTLAQNISFTFQALTAWFVPSYNFLAESLGFLLPLLATTVILSLFFIRPKGFKKILSFLLVSEIFIAFYITFLVVSSTFIFYDKLSVSHRFFSPLYVFVMLLIFMSIENIANYLSHRRKLRVIWLMMALLWVVGLMQVGPVVLEQHQQGAGGYNSVFWQEKPVVEWLKTSPLPGTLYSNEHTAVYLFTQQVTHMIDELLTQTQLPAGDNYLVWFEEPFFFTSHLFELEEISSKFGLERVAEYSYATVYRLVPR
ncbi:MAG: hypothetical protein JXB47_20615 [Anaerolineae bacterium]|nr:hypothetical protein [Anaerolineae bacterium]